MNDNGLKECFEVDGYFFKHEENANARARTKDPVAEVKKHTLNAGPVKKKAE